MLVWLKPVDKAHLVMLAWERLMAEARLIILSWMSGPFKRLSSCLGNVVLVVNSQASDGRLARSW